LSINSNEKGGVEMIDGPRVIALNLTNRCNLRCPHCGRRKHDGEIANEMSTPFFLDILAQAYKMGSRSVNITGGEIFCRSDIIQLIEGAVGLGYSVTLESNGTLIDKDQIKCLSAMSIPIRISISLDGFSDQVHDFVRGNGNFQKTLETLHLLKSFRVPTRVITVLNKRNIEQIPEMALKLVDEMGIGFRLLPTIMELGRGVYACNDIGVSYYDAKLFLDNFFFDFMLGRGAKKVCIGLNVALVPLDIDGHQLCPWGKDMIGINPSGVASICHVSEGNDCFTFGDLNTQSFEQIWEQSENLNRLRYMDPNSLKGVCGNCLAKSLCRGGCRVHAMSKYHDFLAPDPQCQTVYNLGMFPEYALEDSLLDCRYK